MGPRQFCRGLYYPWKVCSFVEVLKVLLSLQAQLASMAWGTHYLFRLKHQPQPYLSSKISPSYIPATGYSYFKTVQLDCSLELGARTTLCQYFFIYTGYYSVSGINSKSWFYPLKPLTFYLKDLLFLFLFPQILKSSSEAFSSRWAEAGGYKRDSFFKVVTCCLWRGGQVPFYSLRHSERTVLVFSDHSTLGCCWFYVGFLCHSAFIFIYFCFLFYV